MKRKRKLKCIKGLSASASSRLRKRVRDERLAAADGFVISYKRFGKVKNRAIRQICWRWVQEERAKYNRARALAAECGV